MTPPNIPLTHVGWSALGTLWAGGIGVSLQEAL